MKSPRPWSWIPSLYFAEGIPYVLVVTVSVIMYKRLGVSNAEIGFVTSWLYLPWVLKPLWSPYVDLHSTKRRWTVGLQAVGALTLGAVALAVHLPAFVAVTALLFAAMAVASATHDIACDGFYMLALPVRTQTAFVGVRTTFYRIAMVTGQGALVVLAGQLERSLGNVTRAWALTLGVAAVGFALLAAWHAFVLPRPESDGPRVAAGRGEGAESTAGFLEVFRSFFQQPDVGRVIAFLLLYRLGEAQLVKMVSPFLLDPKTAGGLGLSTSEVGLAYGTAGIVALTAGGLLGGVLAARFGFRRMLWVFVIAIHLPDLVFVWLSQVQPSDLALVSTAVAVEQFGYGFGFTAYTLFMLTIARAPFKTAHYAIATGFMALGMMIPGMFSGALQEVLGWRGFFLWVMLCTIPGFVVAARVRIPEGRDTSTHA